MDWTFDARDLFDNLDAADAARLDEASFGIVAMTPNGHVTEYNAAESRLAGLSPDRVIGRHFFSEVAPCTNNFMVAQRFENEATLDATIDYVFTLRMRATDVRLRLLKAPEHRLMYLLVDRR